MAVLQAEIFKDPIPEGYYFEDWGIHIQSIYSPVRLCDKVASACLFGYPDRVKSGKLKYYQKRMKNYLEGIKKSLYFVRYRKDWTFRVYLDYSIISGTYESNQNGYRKLCENVIGTLESFILKFPQNLQIYGVRNGGSMDKSSTYVPSLWRFLPLFDESVDAFVCSDADNPFNSLYLHLAETTLFAKATGKFFMIVPDAYSPEQCLVHAAMTLDRKNPAMCLNAQLWGARKFMEDKTIADRSLFTKLLKTMRDPDILFVWSNVEELLASRSLLLTAISTDTENLLKPLLRSDSFESMRDSIISLAQFTIDKIKNDRTVQDKISDKLKSFIDRAYSQKWMTAYIAFLLFPTLLNQYYSVTRWVADVKFHEVVVPIVTDQSYGVDEWLLHVLYDEVQQYDEVIVLRSSVQSCGLAFRDFISIQNDDPGNLIRLMNDLSGNLWPPYGEIVARTVTYLRIIEPNNDDDTINSIFKQLKINFYRRLFLIAHTTFTSIGMSFPAVYRLLDSLYFNRTFQSQSMGRVMKITNVQKFQDWLKEHNVTFDVKNRKFDYTYSTLEAFAIVRETCLRIFVDVKMLHMFQFSEDLDAQKIPWN